MIGDEDIYAILVSAQVFELIDGDGNTVGQFGPVPPYVGTYPAFGILMDHLDPTVDPSELFWTASQPAGTTPDVQVVGLRGPVAGGANFGGVNIIRSTTLGPVAHRVEIQTGADASWGPTAAPALYLWNEQGVGNSSARLAASDIAIGDIGGGFTPSGIDLRPSGSGAVTLNGVPARMMVGAANLQAPSVAVNTVTVTLINSVVPAGVDRALCIWEGFGTYTGAGAVILGVSLAHNGIAQRTRNWTPANVAGTQRSALGSSQMLTVNPGDSIQVTSTASAAGFFQCGAGLSVIYFSAQ